MKKVIFALFALALVAAPASASVQNIKVSGDIDSTWLVRDQFDLGHSTYGNQFYQNLLLTQTRVRVDADLTDNVSTTVGLINERAWGADTDSSNGSNDIDLNLAYVTMREMLYSPLTVTIGRQNFAFGNSLIIDSTGTNRVADSGGIKSVAEDLTKRTSQDAIRLTFDYNPLVIDVIASKINANTLVGAGYQDDDVDLFGTNAAWEIGDELNTKIESYFWAKIDQSVKNTAGDKADSIYTPGVRASMNILDGLNIQNELAFQVGNKTDTDGVAGTIDNVSRRAMAFQTGATYSLPLEDTKKWEPVLSTQYTYVSGDSNPAEPGKTVGRDTNEYYTAWDPMYENQGGGTIYNTLFDLTNMHIVKLAGEMKPMQDVTLGLAYNMLWLDKVIKDGTDPEKGNSTNFTLYQPDGTSISSVNMSSNKELGSEMDLTLTYDYTEDVQFGMSYGMFFPGNAFAQQDKNASQMLLHGNVNF